MGDSTNNEKSPKAKAKNSFFKGVKTEFKKISWPDKNQMFKQSVAVVSISVVIGMIIALLDTVLQYLVSFLTM